MGTGTIGLLPPDIGCHRDGNTGIPYVHSFAGAEPGPHVVVNALMHGNELCGAHALDIVLRAALRPRRGRLSLAFCNVEAFDAFDVRNPTASRYVDEDMNRVWSQDLLDGKRDSVELARARALRPLFDTADLLLDLHSMQTDTAPLMLCGRTERARDFARRVGCPDWVVADAGHAAGRRLIDYGRFVEPGGTAVALLAECGQHWLTTSVPVACESAARFLLAAGVVDAADVARWLRPAGRSAAPPPSRVVEVTEAVTVATDRFRFAQEYLGMELIPNRGTVIAQDGDTPVLTPYDDCLLIMPSRRLVRGQTAVRLGRILP